MKIVGLITEYNPFHNGHQYHIEEAKRITGADIAIVVMSGDFVQRGTPAFIDKYSRTRMALSCGADIIFELPVCYATGSAEFFALGAVSILDKLGIVDYLCFGSECGDIKSLTSLAQILLDEPLEYKRLLNTLLKEGNSYPAARMEAVRHCTSEVENSILASPNNILGVEYIKALLSLKSPIIPITIKRKNADYHEEELSKSIDSNISSATAIRKTLRDDKMLSALKLQVPDSVYEILQLQYNKTFPISEDDYSLIINYKLMQESISSLTAYTDVPSDLANRIYKIDKTCLTFSQLAQNIKSKQWTLTRINRVLIHILLNLYSADFEVFNQSGYSAYARLLGFKKASSPFLRQIVKNERIPVITKLADAANILSENGMKMLSEDIFAAQLYNQVIFSKYGTVQKDEYTHGVIQY
jgi:predicted nucleotidyltransferase